MGRLDGTVVASVGRCCDVSAKLVGLVQLLLRSGCWLGLLARDWVLEWKLVLRFLNFLNVLRLVSLSVSCLNSNSQNEKNGLGS